MIRRDTFRGGIARLAAVAVISAGFTTINVDAGAIPPTPGEFAYITINDAAQFEGDLGDSPELVFYLKLSEPTTGPVTVDFRTRDVTAEAPADYRAKTGTVTFARSVTTAMLKIKIRGDTLREHGEEMKVRLSRPTGGALIDDDRARGIINDDDPV